MNYRWNKRHHQRHLTRSNRPSLMLSTATSHKARIQIWETNTYTQMSQQIMTVKQMTLLHTLNYDAKTMIIAQWRRLAMCTHKFRSDRHCTLLKISYSHFVFLCICAFILRVVVVVIVVDVIRVRAIPRKKPKAPSFQIGSGSNLVGNFFT